MKIKLKGLCQKKISNLYILFVALISLIVIGTYFSYAMFTVNKEKKDAISIVTGNLAYTLTVDGVESNELTVESGMIQEFTVVLSNPNNRIARFNLYYTGNLAEGVKAGYINGENTPPLEIGKNLQVSGTTGSSETYQIKVKNNTDTAQTITLGVEVGLDYNDLSLPENAHLFVEYLPSQAILKLLADNPVQETIDGMFTYTSEGKNSSSATVNSTYVTNGMYMMEDEDGESYYFRGNVDNIVQFGTYEEDYYVYRYNNQDFQTLESCQASNSSCSESNKVLKYTAGTPMYWRIVRVNGDGTLRLLYSGTSKDATEDDLMIGYSKYNKDDNDPKYAGYTYDNGTDSLIKKEVDTWYKIAFSTSSYDKYIAEGRFCSDSSGYGDSAYDTSGTTYFASYDRLQTGNPTLICPETTETFGGSYRLKAGLMTVDEMVLGGDKRRVTSNNYLSSGTAHYWTMSPAYFDGDYAGTWTRIGYLNSNYVFGSYLLVRPVINVDVTDLTLTNSEDGSYYILSP